MKEVVEMIEILLTLRTDTYLKCKYILLVVSRESQETHEFIKELFRVTDNNRPPLIAELEKETDCI